MSVQIKARFVGDFQVELGHGPSGNRQLTDLPVDNGGKGRTFSPTDLFAGSLASCILTIMAKAVEKDGIVLDGAEIVVEKEMSAAPPRRIGRIFGVVTLPACVPEAALPKLKACVQACPVHRSLHPDLQVELEFRRGV
jgi:putative redox protein